MLSKSSDNKQKTQIDNNKTDTSETSDKSKKSETSHKITKLNLLDYYHIYFSIF